MFLELNPELECMRLEKNYASIWDWVGRLNASEFEDRNLSKGAAIGFSAAKFP